MERKEVKVRSYTRRKPDKEDGKGVEAQVVAPDEAPGIVKVQPPQISTPQLRAGGKPGVTVIGGGGGKGDVRVMSRGSK